MGRLGICANIFTNHIWYWGDQHYEQTMGPERARGMWACRTALENRVRCRSTPTPGSPRSAT